MLKKEEWIPKDLQEESHKQLYEWVLTLESLWIQHELPLDIRKYLFHMLVPVAPPPYPLLCDTCYTPSRSGFSTVWYIVSTDMEPGLRYTPADMVRTTFSTERRCTFCLAPTPKEFYVCSGCRPGFWMYTQATVEEEEEEEND